MNWRDKILKEYKEHDKNCNCVFCEKKKVMTNTQYLKSLKNKLEEIEKDFNMGILTTKEYVYKNNLINQSIIKFKRSINQ